MTKLRTTLDIIEKQIPAFAFIDIQEEALNILSSATNYLPMVFELNEIVYENDQSATF